MSKQVKVPKKFEWMLPYIEVGMTFVSPEHSLERVGAWSLRRTRGQGVHASLFQDKIGGPHRIWLHTHYIGDTSKDLKPFSKIDLLNNLAHEIAHMEDWKHTPRHSLIEAKIKAVFMVMLEKDGYISEEKELEDEGLS